jgi:hypothetical protein
MLRLVLEPIFLSGYFLICVSYFFLLSFTYLLSFLFYFLFLLVLFFVSCSRYQKRKEKVNKISTNLATL